VGVPWPVNIVTLKNRTLSPAVERFIECTRDFSRPIREGRSIGKLSIMRAPNTRSQSANQPAASRAR